MQFVPSKVILAQKEMEEAILQYVLKRFTGADTVTIVMREGQRGEHSYSAEVVINEKSDEDRLEFRF